MSPKPGRGGPSPKPGRGGPSPKPGRGAPKPQGAPRARSAQGREPGAAPRARSVQGREPGAGRPARPARSVEPVLGGEQIEGRRAVHELLAAGRRPVRDVWVSETLDEGPIVAEILELAEAAGVTVRRVPRSRIDAEARTDAAQGVLAHTRPLAESDLVDLCRRRTGEPAPFLIAFDGVTDPQNVGAVLRTAEIAGATGVVLPKHRSAHITPTVAKAAAGAIEYLRFAVVPGIPAALATMSEHGVWTVGLDAEAERSVWELEVATEPIALVLGAEGAGLSRLARARCDVLVGIPQAGRIASLNVAAAAAIAAFEISRRRGDLH